MNQKKFEYQNKDIPFLRKDIVWRMCFMALFALVFIAQIIMLIVSYFKGNATTTMVIVSSVIMVISLMLTILSLSFAFKDIRLINVIKKSGFVVSAVSTLPSLEKRSFIKLYSIISEVLAIAMLLILASSLTYSILELVYFTTYSFYLPMLLLITFTGFNTVYHVNHEIKLTETVRAYNNVL